MKELEPLAKTIYENGIEYILDEKTETYLPNLLPTEDEEAEPIGKYGQMRKAYMKENQNSIYQAMLLQGTLYPHLREVDREANSRLETMMPELMKANGVTEQLKATDQMKWVGMMNNLKHSAEEIILSELIYT